MRFPKKKLLIKLTTITLLLFFLFCFFGYARAQVDPELEYPEAFGKEPTKSLPDFVNYIYRFAIGSAGFLSVMMLIVGGIRLIGSGGNPQRLENAKKQIQNSILGLAMVFFSFFIISSINPDFLILREPAVQQLSNDSSVDDLIKGWKEEHKTITGGRNKTSLRIGAVYDAGKEIDCYKEMPLPDPDKEETEEDQIEKYLIRGDQEQECGGPPGSNEEDRDPIVDGNKNHIYCCKWNFSAYNKLNEDFEGNPPEWLEQKLQVTETSSICTIGKSCTKIEGDQDGCEHPTTCAEIKEMGLKSSCNDNYIYCLTDQPPPAPTSSNGPGSSGNKEENNEEGVKNIGCSCDHPLQGPPNNGYTCQNSPETSGYCSTNEVCFNKKCYDVSQPGRCFCISQSNYKCVRDTVTPEAIRMIETIKTGSCGGLKCSGVTTYPKIPCPRETGHTSK